MKKKTNSRNIFLLIQSLNFQVYTLVGLNLDDFYLYEKKNEIKDCNCMPSFDLGVKVLVVLLRIIKWNMKDRLKLYVIIKEILFQQGPNTSEQSR